MHFHLEASKIQATFDYFIYYFLWKDVKQLRPDVKQRCTLHLVQRTCVL